MFMEMIANLWVGTRQRHWWCPGWRRACWACRARLCAWFRGWSSRWGRGVWRHRRRAWARRATSSSGTLRHLCYRITFSFHRNNRDTITQKKDHVIPHSTQKTTKTKKQIPLFYLNTRQQICKVLHSGGDRRERIQRVSQKPQPGSLGVKITNISIIILTPVNLHLRDVHFLFVPHANLHAYNWPSFHIFSCSKLII